jgi:sulfur-carrier protein
VKVRLRFFASLRERLRRAEAERQIRDGASVGEVWSALCEEDPSLVELTPSISFAVNQEYVGRDATLHEGDELALIPPVSGGCPHAGAHTRAGGNRSQSRLRR